MMGNIIDDLKTQSFSIIAADIEWDSKFVDLYQTITDWFTNTSEIDRERHVAIHSSIKHPGRIGYNRVHDGKEVFRFRRQPGTMFGLPFETPASEVADYLHSLSLRILTRLLRHYRIDVSSFLQNHIDNDDTCQFAASPFDLFTHQKQKSLQIAARMSILGILR